MKFHSVWKKQAREQFRKYIFDTIDINKEVKMGSEEPKTYVATVIRDDFFNDPFFKVYFIEFLVKIVTF